MIFYHYSAEEFDTLKSLVAQEKTNRSRVKFSGILDNIKGKLIKFKDRFLPGDEFSYDRSLSFFLEPIPLDIAELYANKHERWKSGLELYQYEVSLDKLPKSIAFRLCESTKKTKLLYEQQDWSKVETDPAVADVYIEEVHELEKRLGYIGHGVNELVKACRPFRRGLRDSIKKANQLARKNPDDGIMKKYAACVPHLMIYPGYKEIEFSKVSKIILD